MTDLILVPTAEEHQAISARFEAHGDATGWALQQCGFGPIAAAARTSALLLRYRPQRVLLIGIAGSFDVQQNPVGSACRFDQVACFGVGAGSGSHYRSAGELGWKQICGGDAQPSIGDELRLTSTFVHAVPCHGLLLTVCAASADQEDIDQRLRQFPQAVAEDMEGFGVAMACALANVPLQIVRGISNQVGNRDHSTWQVDAALDAATELAMQILPWRWIPSET
ncbi:MAG: futalosine hydrolase [Pirellulales bacterium]|nr:futalosine hydrolase [Pirellulales bacterium]